MENSKSLLLVVALAIPMICASQSTTYYGSGAGTSGLYNAFFGNLAGANNTTGSSNSFYGYSSGSGTTSGGYNAYFGMAAGLNNQTGWRNSCFGADAGTYILNGSDNTFIGTGAGHSLITGSNNTAIGAWTGWISNFSNSTAIGFGVSISASNQVRIGNSSVTSIGGQVGWTTLSDGRFKANIKNDVPGLEFISSLNPVSYNIDNQKFDHYVGMNDRVSESSRTYPRLSERRIGLVAQEVEEVIVKNNLDIGIVDKPKGEKDYYGIRYSEFVVPLIKAVKELNELISNQQAEIDNLKAELENSNKTSNSNLIKDTGLRMEQNFPNPFSIETEIDLYVDQTYIEAKINLFDLRGSLIKSIPVNGRGNTKISVSSEGINEGIYLYALIADNQVIESKKMIVSK